MKPVQPKRVAGFTVIELLVVLAAVAVLLSVAMPRYMDHVARARETALRHDLRAVRDAIDKFHADHSRYPANLEELVARRYLRAVPVDPIIERSDAWVKLPPGGGAGGLADLRSGAPGQASDGTPYANW